MRAIQVVSLDGPSAVRVVDTPEPTSDGSNADKVLIEVHAAGVAFPDVLLSQGRYQLKPPPPFTLGGEIAGVVRAAPAGSGFDVGDRVAALPWFGGFADLALAAPDMTFPLPDSVGFAAAAAVPINYFTAQFALAHRSRVQPGQTVLVHGAAGGVGTASIQFARALDATVIAVASTDEKADLARRAGAQHTVAADGFREAVGELTDGRGVDIVVDPVGGDRFTDSLRSLAREGQLLVIGFVGGEIPTVKVNRLLLHNTSVVGVAWGEYALANPGFIAQQWTELLPLLESGALDPPIGHRLPLDEAAQAMTLMDDRRAVGKVVLEVR